MLADSDALASAVAADPAAGVARYDGWSLVELGRHVGQIHRWVTGVVEARAQERPPGGAPVEVSPEDLPEWITGGAARLVEVLRDADPGEQVWTISRSHGDVAFWRRRMALETALHRWDAEDALGWDAQVDPALALEGIDEALHVYVAQRLDGRDVGGVGEQVAFVPDASAGWTLSLYDDHVAVAPGVDGADATVAGTAAQVWLLLCGRQELAGLAVDGDRAAAALAVRAAGLVPGPAG